MGWLLLLFIALPAVELALLIEVGQRIGTLPTLAIIVVTGVVGASMARSQGLRVLSRVRTELDAGSVPGEAIIDGLMILIASALLVTPGVLTDVVGFACLVPGFRAIVKRQLRERFERAVAEGQLRVNVHGMPRGPFDASGPFDPQGRAAARDPFAPPGSADDEMIDVTPRSERKH